MWYRDLWFRKRYMKDKDLEYNDSLINKLVMDKK